MDLYVAESSDDEDGDDENKSEGDDERLEGEMVPKMSVWCGLSAFLPYSIVMDVIQSK